MRARCPNPVAPPGEPFDSVAEVVFWAMPALKARHDGVRILAGLGDARPCEPVDVQVVIAALVRSGRLVAMHVKALVQFGQLGWPPDPEQPSEAPYAPWWDEALDFLQTPMVAKGIVRAPVQARPS